MIDVIVEMVCLSSAGTDPFCFDCVTDYSHSQRRGRFFGSGLSPNNRTYVAMIVDRCHAGYC